MAKITHDFWLERRKKKFTESIIMRYVFISVNKKKDGSNFNYASNKMFMLLHFNKNNPKKNVFNFAVIILFLFFVFVFKSHLVHSCRRMTIVPSGGIISSIMLSVNFFCNISSYDILAYITKNYIALIYYAKIVHLLCQFHAGKVGFSAVCQAIYS